ncbi:phosphoribosylanthranilate isomerase [Leptothermofonsia sp. ETS-13]|uniref:phosphoribosylanthranilate isomerase n=1 Tax=Leptothermofonsia sp. ETS-13 TaxID=3035696 RepID=UPI003BA2AC50
MGLRVKICGITKVEQGRAIAEMGATALGFICARQSPRYVLPEQIGAIVAGLPVNLEGMVRCDRIGVFVNASIEEIGKTVAIGHLSGVQLHGDESPEFCQQLRAVLPTIEIIKALRVRTIAVLEEVTRYEGVIDALLLDAYHPNLPGGTGKTLNWRSLHQFRPPFPWLLAGGLTPDNILDALEQVAPDGVDLSSSVERSPGDKDLEKVERLFRELSKPGIEQMGR